MSTIIAAPYPQTNVTIVLPSAEYEDSKASESSVTVSRSMAGDTYTYVKSSDRYRVTLPFRLSRMKLIELQNFLRIYYRATMLVTMHDGTTWEAALITNPFEGRATSRSESWPGKEAGEIRLELSARKLS